jgi:putative addiction module antidote
MFYQKARKVGNSLVVTIPKEEVERLGIEEGGLLAVSVQKTEVRPVVSNEIKQAFQESWERNKEGYRYLAGR